MLSQGWIGPEGGSLVAETEHGTVEVRVPAGALDEPRLLTIEPRAPLGGALGPVYDLGPSGTRFSKAVEVGLVPRGASGLGGIVERRQVATLGRSGWERLPAVRGVAGERVGLTEHFSLFGLVEEPEGNLSVRGQGQGQLFEAAPVTLRTSAPVSLSSMAVGGAFVSFALQGQGEVELSVQGLVPELEVFTYEPPSLLPTRRRVDGGGTVRWTTSLSGSSRAFWLQAALGTLKIDGTFADGGDCALVGSFDPVTQTCTLSSDVADNLELNSPGLTLDCDGHRVAPVASVPAVKVSLSGSTVRGCQIVGSATGVLVGPGVTGTQILSNSITNTSNASPGIHLLVPGPQTVVQDNVIVAAEGLLLQEAGMATIERNVVRAAVGLRGISSLTAFNRIEGNTWTTVDFPGASLLRGVHLEDAAYNRLIGNSFSGRLVGQRGDLVGISIVRIGYSGLVGNTVEGFGVGVNLGATEGMELMFNHLLDNGAAIAITAPIPPLGTGPRVAFNDLVGNGPPQLLSVSSVALVDGLDVPGSPTFGKGNFWGHDCLQPAAFVPGQDANTDWQGTPVAVVDPAPFAVPVADTDPDDLAALAALTPPACPEVVNHPPVLLQPLFDLVLEQDGQALSVALSAHFDDPDLANGDHLTFSTTTTDPVLIGLEVDGGVLVVRPAAGLDGLASVTVRATDAAGQFVEDTFEVEVQPANLPPWLIAPLPTLELLEDGEPVQLDLAAHVVDPEGEPLALSLIALSEPERLLLGLDGMVLTVTPAPDQHGPATLTILVSDPEGASVEVEVLVLVEAVNDPPVVRPTAWSTVAGEPVTIGIEAWDVDDCELGFELVSLPAHGTLSVLLPELCDPGEPNRDRVLATWTATPSFAGFDRFEVVASDGELKSAPGVVTVWVQGNVETFVQTVLPNDFVPGRTTLPGGMQETLVGMAAMSASIARIEAKMRPRCDDQSTEQTVMLTEQPTHLMLANGLGDLEPRPLTSLSVPPGCLTELRLLVDRMTITLDDGVYEVRVPSGESSGLKLRLAGRGLTVLGDARSRLTLAIAPFDLLGRNRQGFWLRPQLLVAPATPLNDTDRTQLSMRDVWLEPAFAYLKPAQPLLDAMRSPQAPSWEPPPESVAVLDELASAWEPVLAAAVADGYGMERIERLYDLFKLAFLGERGFVPPSAQIDVAVGDLDVPIADPSVVLGESERCPFDDEQGEPVYETPRFITRWAVAPVFFQSYVLEAGMSYTWTFTDLPAGADPVLRLFTHGDEGPEQEVVRVDRWASGAPTFLPRAESLTFSPPPGQGGIYWLMVHAYGDRTAGSGRLLLNGQPDNRTHPEARIRFGGLFASFCDLRPTERLTTVYEPIGADAHELLIVRGPRTGPVIGFRYAHDGDDGIFRSVTWAPPGPGPLPVTALFTAGVLTPPEPAANPFQLSLARNDLGDDDDRDGLGPALEAALGTCNLADADTDACRGRVPSDTDGDGITDGYEVFGHAGRDEDLPLRWWGSSPRHKDVFFQIDFEPGIFPVAVGPHSAPWTRLVADGQDRLREIQDIYDPPDLSTAAWLDNPDGADGVRLHFDLFGVDAFGYGHNPVLAFDGGGSGVARFAGDPCARGQTCVMLDRPEEDQQLCVPTAGFFFPHDLPAGFHGDCTQRSDCEPGLSCIDGTCACRTAADCPDGRSCSEGHRCVPGTLAINTDSMDEVALMDDLRECKPSASSIRGNCEVGYVCRGVDDGTHSVKSYCVKPCATCEDYEDRWAASTSLARKAFFHYGCGTQLTNGWSQTPGRSFRFGGDDEDLGAARLQAVPHEGAHSLGLMHGGRQDINGKPNYISLMNYAYGGTGAGFSIGGEADIEPAALCEEVGLGSPESNAHLLGDPFYRIPPLADPALGVDWNHDGRIDSCEDPVEAPATWSPEGTEVGVAGFVRFDHEDTAEVDPQVRMNDRGERIEQEQGYRSPFGTPSITSLRWPDRDPTLFIFYPVETEGTYLEPEIDARSIVFPDGRCPRDYTGLNEDCAVPRVSAFRHFTGVTGHAVDATVHGETLFLAVRRQEHLQIYKLQPRRGSAFTELDALVGWQSETLFADDAIGEPAIASIGEQVVVVWQSSEQLPFECELHHTLKMSVRSPSGTWSAPRRVTSATGDHSLCGRPNCVLDTTVRPWRPADALWSDYCPIPTPDYADAFVWTSRSSPDLAVRHAPTGDELVLLRTDRSGQFDMLIWQEDHIWAPHQEFTFTQSRAASPACSSNSDHHKTVYCELNDLHCDINLSCCKPDFIQIWSENGELGWNPESSTRARPSLAFRPTDLHARGDNDGEGAFWLLHVHGKPLEPLLCNDRSRIDCAFRGRCVERGLDGGSASYPLMTQLPPRPFGQRRIDPITAPFLLERDRVRNGTDFGARPVRADAWRSPAGVALHSDPAFTNVHAAMILQRRNEDRPRLHFFPNADGITDVVLTSDNDFETIDDCMCNAINNCSNIFEYRRALENDDDGDGVEDVMDNCPFVYSPDIDPETDQPFDEHPRNGIGDVCESHVAFADCGLLRCPSVRAMCLPSPDEPEHCVWEDENGDEIPDPPVPGEKRCTLHECGLHELHNVYCVERR